MVRDRIVVPRKAFLDDADCTHLCSVLNNCPSLATHPLPNIPNIFFPWLRRPTLVVGWIEGRVEHSHMRLQRNLRRCSVRWKQSNLYVRSRRCMYMSRNNTNKLGNSLHLGSLSGRTECRGPPGAPLSLHEPGNGEPQPRACHHCSLGPSSFRFFSTGRNYCSTRLMPKERHVVSTECAATLKRARVCLGKPGAHAAQ